MRMLKMSKEKGCYIINIKEPKFEKENRKHKNISAEHYFDKFFSLQVI